ncbi:hypothetical protein JCM24511_06329 [Saitozyma sp. JCM 24511]|nr:hypothetical protein JCM24511_06329 [Saitozyma sp. JCM 24511]
MKFFIVATLASLSVVTAIIIPRDTPDAMVARNHELEHRDDLRLSGNAASPFGEGWYFDYYKCERVPPLPRACTNTDANTACRNKGSGYQLDSSCTCLPIHLPTHGPVPGPIPIPSSPVTPLA